MNAVKSGPGPGGSSVRSEWEGCYGAVSSAGLGNLGSWSRSRLTTRSCSRYGRGRDWFGPHTTALALVLLPVAFLLGLAAYARLVQINTVEFHLVLAMNRLRQAYARLEPGVVPFLTTGRTDDERGLVATYMLGGSAGPGSGSTSSSTRRPSWERSTRRSRPWSPSCSSSWRTRRPRCLSSPGEGCSV
jgi:hypothetical protein